MQRWKLWSKMAHCLPSVRVAKNKIVQLLLPVEKASFKCINMYKHLPKRSSTHCDVIPSPAVQHKTYQSSRKRWSIRAFSCTSKRLHFGALVHISISQNGPVLTEMCSPPAVSNIKPTDAE